jgi:hypothetical protein
MAQQEFLFQQSGETRDEAGLALISFAQIRIAREYADGVTASGIAADTLPKGLRLKCGEAVLRFRAATGQEPSWLFIDSTEEKIIVR